MNNANSHVTLTLRPMPGSRFTIWGSDCQLEYQRGKTAQQIQWLRDWIDSQLVPLAAREEAEALAAQEALGEVPAPDMTTAATEAPKAEAAPDYSKPITSFPFLKQANGSDQTGFKPETYANNKNR